VIFSVIIPPASKEEQNNGAYEANRP